MKKILIYQGGWKDGCTLLVPTKKEVDASNEVTQGWLHQKEIKVQSADTLENPSEAFQFNTDYINTSRPKAGMNLMLHINPCPGFCNETQLFS